MSPSKNAFSKLLSQKKHFQIDSLQNIHSQNCSLKIGPSKHTFSKLLSGKIFFKIIHFQNFPFKKVHFQNCALKKNF